MKADDTVLGVFFAFSWIILFYCLFKLNKMEPSSKRVRVTHQLNLGAFNALPREMFQEILSHCSKHTIAVLALTSRDMQKRLADRVSQQTIINAAWNNYQIDYLNQLPKSAKRYKVNQRSIKTGLVKNINCNAKTYCLSMTLHAIRYRHHKMRDAQARVTLRQQLVNGVQLTRNEFQPVKHISQRDKHILEWLRHDPELWLQPVIKAHLFKLGTLDLQHLLTTHWIPKSLQTTEGMKKLCFNHHQGYYNTRLLAVSNFMGRFNLTGQPCERIFFGNVLMIYTPNDSAYHKYSDACDKLKNNLEPDNYGIANPIERYIYH